MKDIVLSNAQVMDYAMLHGVELMEEKKAIPPLLLLSVRQRKISAREMGFFVSLVPSN